MDFDEYDYLEKNFEASDGSNTKNNKDGGGIEKSEKGYRRREKADEDDNVEDRVEEHKSKKRSRNEEDGGDRDLATERHRHRSSRDGEKREKDRDRDKREREKEKERERSRRERSKDSEKSKDRERSRSRRSRSPSRNEREREKSKERERSRSRRSSSRSRIDRERERSRRSRSRSRMEREREREKELMIERERDFESRDSRRFRDKKEEPEADPERDQRTVFAYQMPLKASQYDIFDFFSKAGKVRDVKLIMDRNGRRSKGVGYIEFYDATCVPQAIALSGQLLCGQPVMVKPSEAEKNLVQSTASTGGSGGLTGPYGAVDRKLYVGNLHFNMTELQLRQIFEAFGPVELVQLPTDPETGHCKGFGFVQFAQLEHAKAAQSLNGKLEIAGRTLKVSSVTDHIGAQDSGAKAADFDDDDGGGLALNAQSRALLMAKLDRSGTATSFTGSLGVPPVLNGSAPVQQYINMPMNGAAAFPALPAQIVTPMVQEPIGNPSECLLLKNMFDPATEEEPDFDLDIKEDVEEECSRYGQVKHIHVDKNSAGYVYLRFENVEGASRAQQAMHKRWFARRLISAIFLQPYEYDAKFKAAI